MAELITSIGAVVVAVTAVVARFNETDSSKGFFVRLMKALDVTQIFDTTRKLSD